MDPIRVPAVFQRKLERQREVVGCLHSGIFRYETHRAVGKSLRLRGSAIWTQKPQSQNQNSETKYAPRERSCGNLHGSLLHCLFGRSKALPGCRAVHFKAFPATTDAMTSPNSLVVALPPMSGVRALELASASAIAFSTASAASGIPKCRSIMAPDQICPMGLAIPFPAMSGAEPWTGSNMDGNSLSGLRFPEGAMPIDPTTAGPRSDRISPKRFEPTTPANQSGCRTKCAVKISM